MNLMDLNWDRFAIIFNADLLTIYLNADFCHLFISLVVIRGVYKDFVKDFI